MWKSLFRKAVIKHMDKIYKICCIVMAVILAATLALTLWIGFSGKNPGDVPAARIAVIAIAAVMGITIVFGVVFLKAGGKLAYKIGFYLTHCGLVVLIVGLLLTNLTQTKAYVVVDGADVGVKRTDIVQDGETGKTLLSFDHLICVENYGTTYYDEAKTSPKSYEATVGLYDKASKEPAGTKKLSMNRPARIDGYKVYLMNLYPEGGTAGPNGEILYPHGGVGLLFKHNPGEYVTIYGFAVSLAGVFLSCFSGVKKLKTAKQRDSSGKEGGKNDV